MTLGSLSGLFVLRMIDQLGPLTEEELVRRTRQADIELDFGFQVPLSTYLDALVTSGLVRRTDGSTFEVTDSGGSVLLQVVDARIEPALERVASV